MQNIVKKLYESNQSFIIVFAGSVQLISSIRHKYFNTEKNLECNAPYIIYSRNYTARRTELLNRITEQLKADLISVLRFSRLLETKRKPHFTKKEKLPLKIISVQKIFARTARPREYFYELKIELFYIRQKKLWKKLTFGAVRGHFFVFFLKRGVQIFK